MKKFSFNPLYIGSSRNSGQDWNKIEDYKVSIPFISGQVVIEPELYKGMERCFNPLYIGSSRNTSVR